MNYFPGQYIQALDVAFFTFLKQHLQANADSKKWLMLCCFYYSFP